MSCAAAIGRYASCGAHINFFRGLGRFSPRGTYTPKKGDVIFFQSGYPCHVGLVEWVYGGYVHTIEGNTSGASGLIDNGGGVCRKTYPLYSAYIYGYGRPAYAEGDVSRIISVAISQIGYLEKASNRDLDSFTANAGRNNWTKYGEWFGINGPDGLWCDMFVCWCAWAADQKTTGGSTASPTTEETEDFVEVKTYRNGSTEEVVYADTALTLRTGSLNPWEECECLGICDGRPMVRYVVDGTEVKKIGFVEWRGGVVD